MRTRAQVTAVVISSPNFSGILVSTGMKYIPTDTGLISVFMFFLAAIFARVQNPLTVDTNRFIVFG
jgi:hypothetical protein